jgi:hypothetical protein
MRPNNQQNNKNRSRGRNNNGGRKHGNPLSRNYESNGPDVKVRGNASHIAEKYLQLARDAQSSGDSVMAENYLQHAEHYFRILSAAQPQGQQRDQFGQQTDEDDYDDDFAPMNDRFASPEPRQFNQQPQQQHDQQPQPQQQSIPGSEPVVLAAVEVAAAPQAAEGDAPQGEGEPRRRERRPRRRSRGQGGEGGSDPAGAPQPDVGELPAFLTAGTSPAE